MHNLVLSKVGAFSENGNNEKSRWINHIDFGLIDKVDAINFFGRCQNCLKVLKYFNVEVDHEFTDKLFVQIQFWLQVDGQEVVQYVDLLSARCEHKFLPKLGR